MKTYPEMNEILDAVWREFQRNSERLFQKECEQFRAQTFAGTADEADRQASREVEKSVARLFDKTIRPLYSNLEQIGSSRSDDPAEWARGETKEMVYELLASLHSDPALGATFSEPLDDWFKELFQQACSKRLQWLVDEARIAHAKMPAKNQLGPIPAFDTPLRTAIRDILLRKRGVKLSTGQFAEELATNPAGFEEPDETWKDEKGKQCDSWPQACKTEKLAQRLRNDIYKVRKRLTDAHWL